jgi:hypothetical protein
MRLIFCRAVSYLLFFAGSLGTYPIQLPLRQISSVLIISTDEDEWTRLYVSVNSRLLTPL